METLWIVLKIILFVGGIVSFIQYLKRKSKVNNELNEIHSLAKENLFEIRRLHEEESKLLKKHYLAKFKEPFNTKVYKVKGLVEGFTADDESEDRFTLGGIKLQWVCTYTPSKKENNIPFRKLLDETMRKYTQIENEHGKNLDISFVMERMRDLEHEAEICFKNNDINSSAYVLSFNDWKLADKANKKRA